MRRRTPVTSLGAALACALMALTPASASPSDQAPKPPTNAKKVIFTKSGVLSFDFGIGEQVVPQLVKDFDAIATFVNPDYETWLYGFEFRSQKDRAFLYMVDFNGNGGLFYSAPGVFESVKPVAPVAPLRKKKGDRNEIALYARGDRLDVFLNKVFVDTLALGRLMDAGELSIFASDVQNNKAGTVKYTGFTVRVPASQAITPAAKPIERTQRGQIELTVQRTSYIQWGRPIGMDRPDQGCNSFNDKRPVRQFQASLRIANKSAKPMQLWYPVFFKADGSEAYVCFYVYREALAELAPGQIRDITFAAFVELNETVASAVISDRDLGISNRVTFK